MGSFQKIQLYCCKCWRCKTSIKSVYQPMLVPTKWFPRRQWLRDCPLLACLHGQLFSRLEKAVIKFKLCSKVCNQKIKCDCRVQQSKDQKYTFFSKVYNKLRILSLPTNFSSLFSFQLHDLFRLQPKIWSNFNV